MTTETINLDPIDQDLWFCLCGNHLNQTGFYPCSANGLEIPARNADLYCCGDCGRIIKPETLEVVGRSNVNLATVNGE